MPAQDPRPVALAAPGLASARLKQALVNLQARHISFVQAPMVAQDIFFDDVLLNCDAALIRGEDSVLVRPACRNSYDLDVYPQQEDTHLTKLAAFASLYAQSLPQTARRAWLEIEDYVNNGQVHEDVWKKWAHICCAAVRRNRLEKDTFFASDPGRKHFQIG